MKPVIRFRTPEEGEVGWHDLVKGPISFPNRELDDLVLLRADGVPTYNFGVVVDDLDMDITHVIRGDDHVNNTPRQIHIFNALAENRCPRFAHLPMILGADGERLSKRHGAVSVMQYRDEGFLPEALVNYLARLGWSHGDDEVFTVQAAGRVVRPRPRQPLAGAVRPGEGAVDEPAVHQERGRRAAGFACWCCRSSKCSNPARRWKRSCPS